MFEPNDHYEPGYKPEQENPAEDKSTVVFNYQDGEATRSIENGYFHLNDELYDTLLSEGEIDEGYPLSDRMDNFLDGANSNGLVHILAGDIEKGMHTLKWTRWDDFLQRYDSFKRIQIQEGETTEDFGHRSARIDFIIAEIIEDAINSKSEDIELGLTSQQEIIENKIKENKNNLQVWIAKEKYKNWDLSHAFLIPKVQTHPTNGFDKSSEFFPMAMRAQDIIECIVNELNRYKPIIDIIKIAHHEDLSIDDLRERITVEIIDLAKDSRNGESIEEAELLLEICENIKNYDFYGIVQVSKYKSGDEKGKIKTYNSGEIITFIIETKVDYNLDVNKAYITMLFNSGVLTNEYLVRAGIIQEEKKNEELVIDDEFIGLLMSKINPKIKFNMKIITNEDGKIITAHPNDQKKSLSKQGSFIVR